jgi:phosphoglycerate dehydrogenase-like enzyme
MGERILILAPDPEIYEKPVLERLSGVEVETCTSYAELDPTLRELRPEIVLASKMGLPFPREALYSCPSLQWIQTVSAGVDHLLPIDPRVQVTSASGIHDEALSDYVVCAVLLSNLRFPRFFRQQRERLWAPTELVPARAQILAVLGLGSIGSLAAVKARKLGMRVVGIKARPEMAPEEVDEVHGVDRLRDVVADADFLAVTLPLTPATRGIVDAEVLQSMKPGAVLINVSRGGIVDESALVAALTNGPLGGAVCDVFATEPLPEASELWDLENLVITPHTGDIQGWQARVAELFCDNLERRRAGEPLLNRVDPARGY